MTKNKKSNTKDTQGSHPSSRPHRTRRWSRSDATAAATLTLSSVGLSIVLLLSLGASKPPTALQPGPQATPTIESKTQTTGAMPVLARQDSPQVTDSGSPAMSTTATHAATTSNLFRFTSETARSAFMAANQLTELEMHYVPNLDIYMVEGSAPLLTDGSQPMQNNTYQALLTPSDPSYSSQWYLPTISAPQAWSTQTGSSNTITAVVDTGFALQHQDLVNKWSRNTNEIGPATSEGSAPNCSSRQLTLNKSCNNIDDDNDGYIDNYLGWNFSSDTNNVTAGQTNTTSSSVTHGTIVSGLIGAQSNNSVGISGENWNTKIMPLQALDDTGSGDTVSVSLAIRYAVDHGAHIINLSLGSNGSDAVLAEQVQYAIAHGVAIVAAAGNDGCDCVLYPARYPGVIAVGATTSSNVRASFSSYGSTLTLVAPGTNICSTSWAVGNTTSSYGCGYNGTSFSSPLVAGAVGILVAQNKALTPAQIKAALIASSTQLSPMGGLSRTDMYGSGLLNVNQGIQAVALPQPLGVPINIHTVSQSAPSPSRQNDSLNSTCITADSNTCQIRVINLTTNEIIVLNSAPSQACINYYWNTASYSLTAGTWAVQIYAVTNTSMSVVREEIITINP